MEKKKPGRKRSAYDEKYDEWVAKIVDTDPLESEKKERIDAAVYLGYSDTVLQSIVDATTEIRLTNIMITERKRTAQKGVIK